MSARPHVHVVLREEEATLPSPNGTRGEVTVDLRVYWPPTEAGLRHARNLLDDAFYEARTQIANQQSEGTR